LERIEDRRFDDCELLRFAKLLPGISFIASDAFPAGIKLVMDMCPELDEWDLSRQSNFDVLSRISLLLIHVSGMSNTFKYKVGTQSKFILNQLKTSLGLADSDKCRLFVKYPDSDKMFLLLPNDTLGSVNINDSCQLHVPPADKWPKPIVPAKVVPWLLNELDFEQLEALGEVCQSLFVYRCRNKKTGVEYVSKTIGGNQRDPEQSFREVAVHSSLGHKTIADFTGFSLSARCLEGTLYTLYYSNGSIASYLKTHEVPTTHKMICIYGIAFGMNFLHSNRVQHRDLKPASVLLGSRFEPKICDFRFAKDCEEMSQMSRPSASCEMGTPAYEAPEVDNDEDFTWA
jgi:hypothetical protein